MQSYLHFNDKHVSPSGWGKNSVLEKSFPVKVYHKGCRHLCMMMRGVEKQNSEMVTSAMLGSFRSDEKVRQEFLSLVNR